MEPRECFFHDQFGYCWIENGHWQFQAVDEHEKNMGNPTPVDVTDLVFEHEEDEG